MIRCKDYDKFIKGDIPNNKEVYDIVNKLVQNNAFDKSILTREATQKYGLDGNNQSNGNGGGFFSS